MKKLIIIACLLFLTACASKGQKDFDAGNQFYLEEQWAESIPLLQEAIEKDPESQVFQDRLKVAENRFVDQQLGYILKDGEQDLHLTPERIKSIEKQIAYIFSITPRHSKAISFRSRFEDARRDYYATVRDLYERGNTALRNDELLVAKESFDQLTLLYPHYEDVDQLLKELQRRTGYSRVEEIKQLIVEEKYPEAKAALDTLRETDPENPKTDELQDLLRFRDSYYYYIQKANGLLKGNLLTQARAVYEKALTYNQEDPYAKNQIFEIDRQLGEDFYYSGKKALILGDLLSSIDLLKKAMDVFPGVLEDENFLKANNRLIKELDIHKHKAIQEKHWGTALALEQKILTLHDTRENIKKKSALFEAEVKKDIVLKLGILTFDDPDTENVKGRLFSDLLYAGLLENGIPGLIIVNQEFITPDLAKGKKKTSGLMDKETLEYLHKTSELSLVLSGKILFTDLNTVDTPKLSLKKIPLETTEKEVVDVADPTVEAQPEPEKKFRLVEIKSGSIKKTSGISLIYSFYDAYSGGQILSDAMDKQAIAVDTYTTGFDSEGIESDPLEIPSDTEMSTKVMRSAVESILEDILSRLSQPGLFYMDRATYLANSKKYNEQIFALLRAKYLLPEEMHYKVDGKIDDALRKIIGSKKK